MVKHYIQPSRTGKTTDIIKKLAKDSTSVAIVRSEFIGYMTGFPGIKREQLIGVGMNMTGRMYSDCKSIYIDDLLDFKKEEIDWLYRETHIRFKPETNVFAYSTPKKKYSKEAYLLARMVSPNDLFSDQLLSKENVIAIRHEMNEIDMYMLNASRVSIVVDKKEEVFVGQDLDYFKMTLGTELFDVMYNLNILK